LGLGYVGLPLAVIFAEAGFNVLGIDMDARKVDSINKGQSYIQDVSTEKLARLVNSGKIRASAEFSGLKNIDAVSICVPTPLRKTGDPDMSFIISATDALSEHMLAGMVVVLESSTYPGTTREMLILAAKIGRPTTHPKWSGASPRIAVTSAQLGTSRLLKQFLPYPRLKQLRCPSSWRTPSA
jgi:nucleotide sugar dehydrogenase